MAEKDLALEPSTAASIERFVDAIADKIEGRKSHADKLAIEGEEARCASVVALNAECAKQERLIRESPEFKAYPSVAAVALRFGWTHAEFLENLARGNEPRLMTVAA